MVLDSLLAGLMLFGSFSARTPNVQPNADDYEISIGFSHDNIYVNRQWERELGEFYIDDLFWYKFDNVLYFKPEYMNKESKGVKYLNVNHPCRFKGVKYLDFNGGTCAAASPSKLRHSRSSGDASGGRLVRDIQGMYKLVYTSLG